MQDELNDKSLDVFSKIKGKVKVHFSALKNINGMETLFFKAQEWTRVIKEKIIVTWGSGVKGKAAIAVASLALLWLLFPSCAGGGDGKPRLYSCNTKNLETYARYLIEQEIAKHWDDFFKPLGFTRYTIESGEGFGDARTGGSISAIVAFEPTAKEYWKRIDSTNEDYYNTSLHMSWDSRVDPLTDGETLFTNDEINTLIEKIRLVGDAMPRLYVYRKVTQEEMEDERFCYRMSYNAFVSRKKDGTFMMDPQCAGVDEFKAGFKKEDYIPGYELGSFGMTAEFIRMQNEYVIVAEDNSGKLNAKERALYDAYKNYDDDVVSLTSRLSELRGAFKHENNGDNKSKISSEARVIYRKLSEMLAKPPKAPKF